jgi:hypothetical protein
MASGAVSAAKTISSLVPRLRVLVAANGISLDWIGAVVCATHLRLRLSSAACSGWLVG